MEQQDAGVTSIYQSIELRAESDREPSFFTYAVLPFLLVVAGALLLLGSFYLLNGAIDPDTQELGDVPGTAVLLLLAGGLVLLVGVVLPFVGYYKLIDRRNQHLQRDRVLRSGLLDHARSLTDGTDRTANDLEAMERVHNQALLEENERPAALHLVLVAFVPFWALYVYYFLLKDLPRHSRRQARFLGHADQVLQRARGVSLPQVQPIREHNFVVALLLFLFVPLVGQLVVLYWIFNDPNLHFRRQWAFEDALVAYLKDGPAETPAKGPAQPQPETPAFTVWVCPACEKRYKVPPKRPVRVTCRNCGQKEVLRD